MATAGKRASADAGHAARSDAAAAGLDAVTARGLAGIVIVADGERAAIAVDGLAWGEARRLLRAMGRRLEAGHRAGRAGRRRGKGMRAGG